MDGSTSSSHIWILHYLKVLFGALALVGVILLLSVDSQLDISGNTKNIAPTSLRSTDSGGDFNHAHVMAGRDQKQLVDHPELDLNCMSKRRVPNGPDPIHNRYVSVNYSDKHVCARACMCVEFIYIIFLSVLVYLYTSFLSLENRFSFINLYIYIYMEHMC